MHPKFITIGILAGALIFLVRVFRVNFLAGHWSLEFFLALTGLVFLGAGVYLGVRVRGRGKPASEPAAEGPRLTTADNALLTKRETELVGLLAQGLSNRQIAEQLFISENTVKKHLNNVYSKLEVTRRTQAVSKAVQLGILSPSGQEITLE